MVFWPCVDPFGDRPGKRCRMIIGNAVMYKQIRKLLIMSAAMGVAIPAAAQDEDPVSDDVDDGARSCISLRTIRRTEIIDDRNILFHMRGSTVYHNILPRQCGGLARENRFSYKTTIGRLCSLDLITVLYSDPFGLREGNSCQLGMFHEITREDAKALKEGLNTEPPANPLPMPAPQEIGVGEDEPEEPEPPSPPR